MTTTHHISAQAPLASPPGNATPHTSPARNIVRVSVRISVHGYRRSVDLSLPTSSTFSEVLPEIARLIDLPETASPWEFTTAAGAPLDPHIPLHHMRLRDGHILVLRPEENVDPPVVRDAAESLAAAAAGNGPRAGIDTAASFAGVAAAGMLVGSYAGPLGGVGAAALLALVVGIVAHSRAVFQLGALLTGSTCGGWVAGAWESGAGAEFWPLNPSAALGLLSGCAVAALVLAGGIALGLAGPRSASALLTAFAAVAVGALGAWLPAPEAPAALAILAGLVGVTVTPAVATRAAGLRIPRVPTAGQEFSIADDYQDDVDDRTARALAVTDGIGVGTATVSIPALALIAARGGGWAFSMCVCVAGALIVHASRHHATTPRLSLALMSAAAVAAAAGAVLLADDAHPALIIAAAAVTLVAATAVIWASSVPDLEPTTLVWLERVEAAAIIAVIPLAVHLTGAFDLIRGL